MRMRRFALLLLLAIPVASAGCHSTKAARRYSRAEAARTLERFEKVGLVIGEFPIDGANAVVDGDTIRVKGLQNSLRLLGIDTEETFKKDAEREAFARGWEHYRKAMRGDSDRPVKMATPLGEEAKRWAQAFFEGVTQVKLERDHPGEIRDYYGRYLAYVLVFRNGKWVNFNVEAVRAGMTPYFTKYGYSRRFHREFLEAQAQAREAKLGIWDPSKRGYGDYDERLAWWNKRAEVIARFEKEMEDDPRYIVLTRWDALLQLEQRLGQEVVVLGSANEVRLGDRGPTVLKLGRSRGNDFDVVFFDKDVALAAGVLGAKGEYVRVRGVVQKYRNRYTNKEKLQIVVSLPGQVLAPSAELDERLAEEGPPLDPDGEADVGVVPATATGAASDMTFTTPPPFSEDE